MELTITDIQNLILIGTKEESDLLSLKELAQYFKHRDFINRLGWELWKQNSSLLSNSELIDLFKELVLIELELKWIGGSVAGAIWVYRIIQERRLDVDFQIADFGFRNCENPWIPFGFSYYGNRTIEDYFSYQKEKTIISESKAFRYDHVLKRVKDRKEKRNVAIAELRKLNKESRGLIRKELLEKYSSLSVTKKLEIIANDETYPPEYYPLEWITISSEVIKILPIELIKKLYDKLSTKRKDNGGDFQMN
jgi:hypothetical protein